uniref:Ycf34 n=1 Tax=Ophidocladus simpliciusculus TaxID=1261574 RepID=A0A1Z1MJ38_9FLOR|nr:hypothetical protein [Ophidocladus simpliciusculus]ARW65966.1 hypothetical protein [Ophidocladus simpliciusculus]
MCICINCRHIHYCQTYLFIEKQHKINQVKVNKSLFMPIYTIVNIKFNKQYKKISLDWDLIECLSFVEKPGHWLIKNH